ncbi:MAG: hypothetical protein E2579_12105 [Pseudomonas sp.]|nr:hypothetical protein [Pseudomonas sp.]
MTTLSGLTEQIYSDRDIMGLFSGPGTLRRMLAVEAALARAQARCGVIPDSAARCIDEVCHADDIDGILDLEQIAAASMLAGNIAIPFVKQLTAAVRQVDPEAARYVHWGATSQDILDTALVLQLQQAIAQLDQDIGSAQAACARLTAAHRDTLIVARTWLQHALPTTFGDAVFDQTIGATFGDAFFDQTIGATFSDAVFDQTIRATFGDAVLDQAIGATFGDAVFDQTIGATFGNAVFDQTVGATFGDYRLGGRGGEYVGCQYGESEAEDELAFHDLGAPGVVVGSGADVTHWIFWENFIGLMVKIDAPDSWRKPRTRGLPAV